LLENIFLMDEIDVVEHGLVVDAGEAGDDLHEEGEMWILFLVVDGE
jgi:hypothetical protein